MDMGKFIRIDGIILNSLLTISVVLMMATSTASVCPMSFEVRADNQQNSAVVKFDEPINQTCIPMSGSTLLIGFNPVTCTGDGEPCSFQISVKDTSPPVITDCPQTIQKDISYDLITQLKMSTVVVTWDVPTASDSTGQTTLTSTHDPGAEFSIGSTQVVYTATDSAGNVEICTFTVEVGETGSYTPPMDRIFVKNNPDGNCLSVTWPESEDNAITSYSIYVYKEGEEKRSQERIIAHRGSSTYMHKELCGLQAGQLYVVEVESLFDGKVLTVSARHYTEPLPPTELRALWGTTSPSSLTLSWSRSQQNVDQYEVSTGNMVQYVSKTTDRIEVDSLRPGVSYTMAVRSVVGTGNRRIVSKNLGTPIDTVDFRESELIAYNYTESTITVAWKAVSGSSDELNPYMLIIEPRDAVEDFLTVFSASDAQFTGLKPNTNYHIQLLSNLGFHLETTQRTRPGRIRNLRAVKVLEDFITINWDSPTEGDVDSYDVLISPGHRSEPTNMMGTSFEFSSLTNETEYFISVVSVYNSMKSNPQSMKVTTGVTKPVPTDSLEYVVLAVACVLGVLVLIQLIIIAITCWKCQGIKKNSLDSVSPQKNSLDSNVYDDTENVQGDDGEAYENTMIGSTF